jgi:monofunctional biosynthetic peptidoglycan transglycosylase
MSETQNSILSGGKKAKRQVPLWRRMAVGIVQAGVAVFLLFHLYALLLVALPAPGTILMSQRAGQGEEVRRDWTPLDEMSPDLVLAVIGAEDAKFCEHDGIDWDAIEKAREYNKENPDKRRRGGSTITQQTAKNVFFWNGGGMPRKAGEAWMTYVIETVWGKRRIMEVYLNVAEWGDGLFGAEAAAQARFGKSAAELSSLEAARLAAVLPSPNKWSPDAPGPYVRKRTRSILSRMRVVANEGLAACVLGDEFKASLPPPEKGDAPRAEPKLEEIPEAPEIGEEALEPLVTEEAPGGEALPVEPEADAALDAVLDAADETFNGDAPQAGDTSGEPPVDPPADDAAPTEPVLPESETPPADEGPTVLTPQ